MYPALLLPMFPAIHGARWLPRHGRPAPGQSAVLQVEIDQRLIEHIEFAANPLKYSGVVRSTRMVTNSLRCFDQADGSARLGLAVNDNQDAISAFSKLMPCLAMLPLAFAASHVKCGVAMTQCTYSVHRLSPPMYERRMTPKFSCKKSNYVRAQSRHRADQRPTARRRERWPRRPETSEMPSIASCPHTGGC